MRDYFQELLKDMAPPITWKKLEKIREKQGWKDFENSV